MHMINIVVEARDLTKQVTRPVTGCSLLSQVISLKYILTFSFLLSVSVHITILL
jgi:hypothetical protein